MENNIQNCSSIEHNKIKAIFNCQECKIYMCNKCDNYHSILFKNHHVNKIENDINELFSEFCKKDNHYGKLEFFCKTHNQLCCSDCLCKIKIRGKGEHFDCDICSIEDIKNEKKNKLEENIKNLENLSNSIEESINQLKEVIKTVNANKEQIKLKIQKLFTKIRNILNEREDEVLLEVDKEFSKYYLKEDIEKSFLKLPNKINESLKKGKIIGNEWNNENKLCSLINVCLNIENNIKEINLIKENIDKSKNFVELNFFPKENDDEFNQLLKNIQKFGRIFNNDPNIFKFKKCPIDINGDKGYKVSGENNNIITKTGQDSLIIGIVCDKELKPGRAYRWKIKLIKSKCNGVNVGVTPIDFDFNTKEPFKYGWYLYCKSSTFFSGPPFNYWNKKTKLKIPKNEIIVYMDTQNRILKFKIDEEEEEDFYADIPIDKPIVPIVTLIDKDDSVEIISY